MEPAVLMIIQKDKILDKLTTSLQLLDQINNGLNSYLELKRIYFPRFYFLSNDELLEILSETKNPMMVQSHLKKCFEGIQKLIFKEERLITGMESSEKEVVDFQTVINTDNANGLVEIWIKEVENSMCQSLNYETKCAIDEFMDLDFSVFIKKFPGQIVLLINSVFWTSDITHVFNFN
jgi:dynein heavy chain